MSPELRELKQRRAQKDADAAARKEAAQAERLQKRRDTLLSGEWWPSHACDQCLQAILDKDPSAVCKEGAAHTWWKP